MKKTISIILIAVFAAVLGSSTFYIVRHNKEADNNSRLVVVAKRIVAPYFSLSSFSVRSVVAAGLFCRKMDGRFCRKKPDTDVRRAGRIDVAGVFCRTREGRGQSRSLH